MMRVGAQSRFLQAATFFFYRHLENAKKNAFFFEFSSVFTNFAR